jgi:hypothetical protein
MFKDTEHVVTPDAERSDNPLGDEGAAALAEGLPLVPGLGCFVLG